MCDPSGLASAFGASANVRLNNVHITITIIIYEEIIVSFDYRLSSLVILVIAVH
jgi:hypothetical protein